MSSRGAGSRALQAPSDLSTCPQHGLEIIVAGVRRSAGSRGWRRGLPIAVAGPRPMKTGAPDRLLTDVRSGSLPSHEAAGSEGDFGLRSSHVHHRSPLFSEMCGTACGITMGWLTDRAVRAAVPGRHVDGDNLQLIVSTTGRRKWVFRYQMSGVRRDMGLGAYPSVSLADARIAAADARKAVAQGTDPLDSKKALRRATKPIPTFQAIAQHVIADAQRRSTNAKVRSQWAQLLGPAYCKELLTRPVNEITTLDVAAVLRPVWHVKPEAARKLYPAIRRVFEYARIRLSITVAVFPDL